MFHLNEEVEKVGLQIVGYIEMDDGTLLVADYLYRDCVIARYLFLYSDAASWYAAAVKNLSLDHQIQNIYFTQRNDLSWNLYLVVVMDPDEFSKVHMNEKLEFLRDTEFTRKLMIPSNRFSSMIPVGHIITQEANEEALLPIQDWQEALASAGFSSVWLDKQNEQVLEQFLETGIDKAEKPTATLYPGAQGQGLHSIRSLTIPQEFRPHCYRSELKLDFPLVSLFCGPNGAGKTSILEAIEFAITGAVRKSLGNSPRLDQPVKLNVVTNSGAATILSSFSLSERKRREQEWYASRPDSRKRSQLPQLFHTYNQFSVEDVYLYSQSGGQPEYSQLFSRMLFGNEASLSQTHWQAYAREVERKRREYEQTILELNAELDYLANRPTIERETLTGYLLHSDFAFELDNPTLAHTVCSTVGQIKPLYDKLTWSGDTLPPDRIPDLLRREQSMLVRLQEQLEEKQREDKEKVDRLEAAYTKEAAVQEKQKQVQGWLLQLSNLPISIGTLRFLAHHSDFLTQYGQAQTRFTAAQRHWTQYEAFYNRYQDIETCTEPEQRLVQAEAVHHSLSEQRDIAAQRLQRQDQLIQQAQETANALQVTVSAIRSTGLKYLELQQDAERCPLCGSQVGRDQMLHHLNTAADAQSCELSDLISMQQNLQTEYDRLKAAVQQEDKRICLFHRYQDAWQFVHQAGLDDLLPTLRSNELTLRVRSVFALKAQVEQEYHAAKSELTSLWTLLDPDNQMGTAQTFWEDLAEACRSTKQMLQAIGIQPTDDSALALYSAITAAQERGTKVRLQADLDANSVKNSIVGLESKVLRLQGEIQQIARQIEEQKDHIHKLELLQSLWNQASFYLKPEVRRQGTLDWGKQLPELQRLAAESLEDSRLENEKQQLRDQITAYQFKQENALRLQDAFQELRTLEDYSKKFIQGHLEQISNIFLQLHTPQEYIRLELRTEGTSEELVAVRNISSQDRIPLQEMSTGQQTSVVLSVLLEMHLTMQSVPHFLLIDEPVSNVDDLNILSMLDFFRELVISQNRQLFVTTANQNVARLFRRKFSFLKEGYTEFSLKRSDEMKVAISPRQYDQDGVISRQN